MKKSTTILRILAAFFMLLFFVQTKAQVTCTVSFVYSVGPGGVVSFTANCAPTSSNSNYVWLFGNSTSTVVFTNNTAIGTYTANGNYMVALQYSTAASGGCLGIPQYTAMVNVNTVNSCSLVLNSTPATSGCDGAVTVSSVTGLGLCMPVTYTIMPGGGTIGMSNFCPGNYTVIAASGGTGNCCPTATGFITVANGTCNISANFTSSQGGNGLVNFNSTSTGTNGGTTYSWNFGNGTFGTTPNPSNTYSANGTYIVSMIAANSSVCVSTKTAAIIINNICNLNASFTYTNNANGQVAFTGSNGTTNTPVFYTWTYGNGSTGNGFTNSSTFPGAQTYTNGNYIVILTVSNSSISPTCSSSISQTITVSNATCALNANFTYSQGNNGAVNFNNTTSGTVPGTTYSWNFGDGGSGNLTSPAHTYSANGSYVVTLLASNNSSPSCTSTKVLTITVNSYCVLQAGFTSSSNAGGLVNYSNTSANANGSTYYTWNFGDGSPVGHQTNPSHLYATSGTYTVCLTAANFSFAPTCTSSICQTISVTNTCVANANFTLLPSGTPQLWFAIPSMSANIAAAMWYWGDGSTSNSLWTSHQYSVAGTYSICLSITLTCGSSAMACTSYSIYRTISNNEIIQINVIPEGEVGIKEQLNSLAGKVSVFPNPNNGEFNLQLKGMEGKVNVDVYDVLGQVIWSEEQQARGTTVKTIEMDTAQNGIYFIKVSQGDRYTIRRIAIQK